ncbi:MAG: OmpA family protein [Myxococcales bacterium]|nr:OmpA family protein [Myxococcales bacterium]
MTAGASQRPSFARAALATALTLGSSCALWSCVTQQSATPSQNNAAIAAQNAAFYQEQIVTARQALERQEWEAARQSLEGVVEAVPPTDPLGAEARAGLARIAFELGDYTRAAQLGAEVPASSNWAISALESRGLAQLFSCNFEGATQTFYQLREVDAPRGQVWLGVAAAWTGADANAERELSGVIAQNASNEHGPNARFYLTQLALWQRRPGPAQRYLQQLQSASPDYLTTLDQRGQNWLQRHTHLMRAYFTFDTLARLGRLTRAATVTAQDQRADEALRMLQQNPGACGEQVTRLAQARQASANDRAAYADATRDRDGDGVPDREDRCPDEAETRNGISDDDGCAESTAAIEVEGNQIRIRSGFAINFGPGDDRMLDASRGVIEQLAQLLQSPQYAWVRRIRLDGHTDNTGDPAVNLGLSERRVRSVGAALVGRGIDRGRITFQAYGSTRPIDPSDNDQARASNRRVEIFIVDPPMFGGVRAQ